MTSLPVYVGLDYHKSVVQVCVLDRSGRILTNQKCPNEWQAIHNVVARHSTCIHAAIEACNGAANLADELIEHAGWSIALAHPGYVARMKQGPDKTDWGDARLIGDLVRVGYLPKVWLAPQAIREMRRLVRYRQQLAKLRRNTKLRIGALLRDHRIKIADFNPWTHGWLFCVKSTQELSGASRWIMDQHLDELKQVIQKLDVVEKKLMEFTSADRLIEKLLTIPGVGFITAVTMRAEIGRFDRFRNGKQLSRFCSLSPRNASSGQRQADAGIVKAGNPELRRVLLQAAHRLSRYEPRWKALATKLEDGGKRKPVVVAAIANRWVRSLHRQLTSYGLGYSN